MELEKIKFLWQEEHDKLNETIELNKRKPENTFKQQANGVLEGLLRWEYFSLIEFIVFLMFMSIATYKSMHDWRLLSSGIFVVSYLLIGVISAIRNIRRINKIDLFSNGIVQTKQSILRYQEQATKSLRIILYTIPPVIVSFISVGVNFIRGINLFDFPLIFSVIAIGIIVLSFPIAIISHKRIFSRKFIQINNSLKELEMFTDDTL